MPGRASGEVMLALTHQEAKTKEKEQANWSNQIRTNLLCHPEVLLLRIWASKETEVRGQWSEVGRVKGTGPSLNGSPFSE